MPAETGQFLSHSPAETRQLGARLGALLQPGDLVCLQGELGAGKTTLVQGLAAGWGAQDAVSSPTFVIINLYRQSKGGKLYHLDTYRLASLPEAEELDLDDLLAEGPLVVEWPERLAGLLPSERLWVKLTDLAVDERQITMEATGERYLQILKSIRVNQKSKIKNQKS
jgi:tRNA threonylcarbamoyladenosine biosynthesis protein TsaE